MRNITISLSDELAQWARVWEAQHDTSISAMLSQTLKEKIELESRYAIAQDRFFSEKTRKNKWRKRLPFSGKFV